MVHGMRGPEVFRDNRTIPKTGFFKGSIYLYSMIPRRAIAT